ncbi:MAG: SprT-like domain-containing protein [Moheibacter sp.]
MRKRLSVKSYYSKLSKVDKEKLAEIEKLAIELMNKHGVGHFKFKYGRSRTYAGNCSSSSQTIRLSIRFVLKNDIERIKNTILHEIAHATVGAEHGHRKVWQDKAKELGVTWTKNYRK